MTISSTRYNTTVSGATIVDKNLNFTFEYNNLIQSGAKLQGFSGSNVGLLQPMDPQFQFCQTRQTTQQILSMWEQIGKAKMHI